MRGEKMKFQKLQAILISSTLFTLLPFAGQSQEVSVQGDRALIELSSKISALDSLISSLVNALNQQVTSVSGTTTNNEIEIQSLRDEIALLRNLLGNNVPVIPDASNTAPNDAELEGIITCSTTFSRTSNSGREVKESSTVYARYSNGQLETKIELTDLLTGATLNTFDWQEGTRRTVSYRNPFSVTSPGGYLGGTASIELLQDAAGNTRGYTLSFDTQLLTIESFSILTSTDNCFTSKEPRTP